MLIMTAVEFYLLADNAIADLIGTRLEAGFLSHSCTLPAITYTMVSAENPELLDGNTDLATATFQFTCWAATLTGARELGALVRMRMLGIGGYAFQKAGVVDERDDPSPDPNINAFRYDVDAQVAYAESSP